MSENNIKDDMLDAMIKIAGREVIRREAEALPNENEIEYNFSPKFESKIKKLMTKTNRRGKGRVALHVWRVAVICIVSVSVLLVGAFAFSPEFRAECLNLLIKWTQNSADFSFSGEQAEPSLTEYPKPTYLPEGFKETSSHIGKSIQEWFYENDKGAKIQYTKMPMDDGGEMSIDSEHSDYSKIKINGHDAHFFESNTAGYYSYVVFDDGVYSYQILGEIPASDLILIAESIK